MTFLSLKIGGNGADGEPDKETGRGSAVASDKGIGKPPMESASEPSAGDVANERPVFGLRLFSPGLTGKRTFLISFLPLPGSWDGKERIVIKNTVTQLLSNAERAIRPCL